MVYMVSLTTTSPKDGETKESKSKQQSIGSKIIEETEGQITAFASIATHESVFAMDDTYLDYKCFNTSYSTQ